MDLGTFDLLFSDDDMDSEMDLPPTQAYSDERSIESAENMDNDDDFWGDIISVVDIEHIYYMYPNPEDEAYDHQAQGNIVKFQDDDRSKKIETPTLSPIKTDFSLSQRQSWNHSNRCRPTRKP